VEKRPIAVDELESFTETGACGTAAVISPIKKIYDRENGKTYEYCKDGKAGPICTKLYKTLQDIQYGDAEDKYGWITFIE